MRYPALALVLLSLIFDARGQQRDDTVEQLIQKKCSILWASLPPDKKTIPNYPVLFDSIRVLDYRSDTSRIGIVGTKPLHQEDVRFPRSVSEQLSAYFRAGYTNPKGNHHLLVVVKNLWVSNAGVRHHPFDNGESWKISLRCEAYAQVQNGYVPITYLDTLLTGSDRSAGLLITHALPDLLLQFMDKLATHDLDVDVIAKRTVSFEEVDSFSRKRFDYPMDTATALVKGVYANVEEFKNNKPSITQYEIEKDKNGDLALSTPDGNGRFVYTHTAWGFCDGSQAFVMMDGNVFPLLRVQHQFYVLGSREYRNNKTWIPFLFPLGPAASVYGITNVHDDVVRSLRLFRLNAQSGKVIE